MFYIIDYSNFCYIFYLFFSPSLSHDNNIRISLSPPPPQESCGPERVQYLRCLVAGLFTNIAMRQPSASRGGGRGCYRTLIGGRETLVHPSSTLWRRNPPAKCVVYTELLSTSKDVSWISRPVRRCWMLTLICENYIVLLSYFFASNFCSCVFCSNHGVFRSGCRTGRSWCFGLDLSRFFGQISWKWHVMWSSPLVCVPVYVDSLGVRLHEEDADLLACER